MTIYLGADHGGYQLKETIRSWLQKQAFDVQDCGAYKLYPKDDYSDFAFKVGKKVVQTPDSKGILFCRSGAGMVIAANRVPHIRAVEGHSVQAAKHAREHNNANILSIAGDWISLKEAKEIIAVFLKTAFTQEERHVRRIEKLERREYL